MPGRSTYAAVALVALFAAVLAPAAERMPDKAVGSTSLKPPAPLDTQAMNAMLRADRDKDGVLSREELEHYDMGLARRFKDADGDGDGRLTFHEFEKLGPAPETAASSR